MNYLKNMQRFHSDVIAPHCGSPVGCSPKEVDELARRIGFRLPEAYRQWLIWMGRDARGIFRGTDCFIGAVGFDPELLAQLSGWDFAFMPVPEKAFVFYSHQGYAVSWFLLPCNVGDPDVFFFSEGKDLTIPYHAGTFTEFMLEDMRGLATLLPPTSKQMQKTYDQN